MVYDKMRGEVTMSLEAEASANVCTFHISSSISIVLYGEFCYDYSDGIINPNFSAVMDVLGIYIDTEKLEKFYFDQLVGEGDIWAIGDHKNNCMVFDLYRDLTDEFDVIVFAVICREEISNRIYELLSAIKEETQPQIAFAEYDIREKRVGFKMLFPEKIITMELDIMGVNLHRR